MRDSQQKHRSMVLNPWPCVINGDLEPHQRNSQQATSRDNMPTTHQLGIHKLCKAHIHILHKHVFHQKIHTRYTHYRQNTHLATYLHYIHGIFAIHLQSIHTIFTEYTLNMCNIWMN